MGDIQLHDEQGDETAPSATTEEIEVEEMRAGGVRALTFWLALVVALVLGLAGGVALSTYVIPPGTLPNDPNASGIDALEAQSALEEDIEDGIAEANEATPETELSMQDPRLAILYTVNAVDLANCADFVGWMGDGQLRTVRLSQVYPCE